jgi:hypothetical protein
VRPARLLTTSYKVQASTQSLAVSASYTPPPSSSQALASVMSSQSAPATFRATQSDFAAARERREGEGDRDGGARERGGDPDRDDRRQPTHGLAIRDVVSAVATRRDDGTQDQGLAAGAELASTRTMRLVVLATATLLAGSPTAIAGPSRGPAPGASVARAGIEASRPRADEARRPGPRTSLAFRRHDRRSNRSRGLLRATEAGTSAAVLATMVAGLTTSGLLFTFTTGAHQSASSVVAAASATAVGTAAVAGGTWLRHRLRR